MSHSHRRPRKRRRTTLPEADPAEPGPVDPAQRPRQHANPPQAGPSGSPADPDQHAAQTPAGGSDDEGSEYVPL
ncbi:MAG TPA: hypothetical protein VGI58_04700 [Streptosporangiaceae bacterium]